ncbi:methyltransferase domain-containing protein [Bacillus sp. JJ1122]|uniref:class I SAM-dependent methyltransferase n=1 Tax=Bacillus sp. JJ1122 TaxID=3122951 RepID=UPI0030004584
MEPRGKWNSKYTDIIANIEERVPNERLLKLSPYLKGGSAIDIACGLGWNSFFLSGIGYKVTAVDISDVAINFVSKQAEKKRLEIRTLVADMSKGTGFHFKKDSYDLVLITYYLDRSLYSKVKDIVKMNGYLFMETFYKTGPGSKKTITEKYKLESNELLEEFKDWKILYYEECEQEGRQSIFCKKQEYPESKNRL